MSPPRAPLASSERYWAHVGSQRKWLPPLYDTSGTAAPFLSKTIRASIAG